MASGLDEKEVARKMKELGIDTDNDPQKDAILKATLAKLDKILTAKSTFEAVMDDLHPLVRARVEKLRELQLTYDTLEDQYLEEQRQLVLKYERLYQPLYDTRTDIVSGKKDGEIAAAGAEGESKEGEGEGEEDVPVGVPEFWAFCMKNNDVVTELITDKDNEVLRYLKDIRYELLGSNLNEEEEEKKKKSGDEDEDDDDDDEEEEEELGFKLYFEFGENPFFSNDVLVKTYRMVDEEEGILERSEGSTIRWKPGKNVTVKVMRKKNKKGSGRSKGPPMTKTEKCDSFFNFFSPPDPEELFGMEEEDEDDVDEEEMEALQDALQEDYEIGCIFKDKIIPHAVSWFTGEALSDDEEEEEGDEDEDEDEDEEDVSVRAQSNSQANTSEASLQGEQPECKQQ